jgi:phospholipid/cholesterol/gamma-HCH transport system substrate-binding protein
MIRSKLLPAAILLLLVVATIAVLTSRSAPEDRSMTAVFARTTNLYEGAQVKVLGVKVGRVDKITVRGTKVEAEITYDADVELPADVHAAIVPPSIVGDRFVQLTPAYDGGDRLADGAEVPLTRTQVPVELDDTYGALNDLAVSLGPKGANQNGALSELVTSAARTLSGNGAAFNETVREFSGSLGTLTTSADDIDATVDNLAKVTGTLAGKDQNLRRLLDLLERVGVQLGGQRTAITTAVTDLEVALADLGSFLEKNDETIERTLVDGAAVSQDLTKRTRELARLLELAPVGLTNLASIYIPTNWDPAKPWETAPAARTGSNNLRAALFQDLDTQLAATMQGICAGLPVAQQPLVAPLCTALRGGGGTIGGLLSQLIEQNAGGPSLGGNSLFDLLSGGA